MSGLPKQFSSITLPAGRTKAGGWRLSTTTQTRCRVTSRSFHQYRRKNSSTTINFERADAQNQNGNGDDQPQLTGTHRHHPRPHLVGQSHHPCRNQCHLTPIGVHHSRATTGVVPYLAPKCPITSIHHVLHLRGWMCLSINIAMSSHTPPSPGRMLRLHRLRGAMCRHYC